MQHTFGQEPAEMLPFGICCSGATTPMQQTHRVFRGDRLLLNIRSKIASHLVSTDSAMPKSLIGKDSTGCLAERQEAQNCLLDSQGR